MDSTTHDSIIDGKPFIRTAERSSQPTVQRFLIPIGLRLEIPIQSIGWKCIKVDEKGWKLVKISAMLWCFSAPLNFWPVRSFSPELSELNLDLPADAFWSFPEMAFSRGQPSKRENCSADLLWGKVYKRRWWGNQETQTPNRNKSV